jgi:translation elongation factor EF-Ts
MGQINSNVTQRVASTNDKSITFTQVYAHRIEQHNIRFRTTIRVEARVLFAEIDMMVIGPGASWQKIGEVKTIDNRTMDELGYTAMRQAFNMELGKEPNIHNKIAMGQDSKFFEEVCLETVKMVKGYYLILDRLLNYAEAIVAF